MKILHIITDTNIGGAGKQLLATLRYLNYDDIDIVVALPCGSAMIPLLSDIPVRVICMKHGHDRSFDISSVKEISDIIKAEKPDIVHTHACLSGRIASYICRVPSRIMTRHCAFENPKSMMHFPVKNINGIMNNALSTRFIATAEIAKTRLIEVGCDKDKISVVLNGSERVRLTSNSERKELLSSLNIPGGAFVVGIAARLEVYKGHKYLLYAASTMRDKPIYFLIIGDGSERERLVGLALSLGISDKIIFTGFVNDVAPYYNIMDVSVNCSYGAETTPLAITEPMSIGVPNIVTRSGGNADIVTDGCDGFVVPECDSDAIAKKIIHLYNNRALKNALGENAKRTYEMRFCAEKMAERIMEIYREEAKRIGL